MLEISSLLPSNLQAWRQAFAEKGEAAKSRRTARTNRSNAGATPPPTPKSAKPTLTASFWSKTEDELKQKPAEGAPAPASAAPEEPVPCTRVPCVNTGCLAAATLLLLMGAQLYVTREWPMADLLVSPPPPSAPPSPPPFLPGLAPHPPPRPPPRPPPSPPPPPPGTAQALEGSRQSTAGPPSELGPTDA